jgi:hypothetical protein
MTTTEGPSKTPIYDAIVAQFGGVPVYQPPPDGAIRRAGFKEKKRLARKTNEALRDAGFTTRGAE